MRAVWKRELQAFFYTPIGYVFMGFFLLVSGYFFWGYNISSQSSSMSNYFSQVTFIFMMFVPILTMRLMSEDRRNKTDQLLITSPTSITSIVVGKFLAACSVLFITTVFTLVYVVIISAYGTPAPGLLFTSYLGFFLLGCVYISIGVLISSLCENQVTAAVITLVVNIMLQVLEYVPSMVSATGFFSWLPSFLGWLSLGTRNTEFASGILSFANILYFLSFMAVALFLTVRVVEKRRWSEA